MWRLGFFFHEMAFGLLSVFIPLYVVLVGGSIIYVGIVSAVAILVAIPSSFFWGYICDKKRHYKRYILLSFLTLTLAIYLLSTCRSIELLIAIYAVMALFHEASEPPKNVLIAELYPHEEWRKAFAFYEAFTEVGWAAGLLMGFATSFLGFTAEFTFMLCSLLNLAAFATSIFLVSDPLLTIERSLVKIEKNVGLAYRGAIIASKILEGARVDEKLEEENVYAFCSGIILFSLATSILFSPLPLFFSTDLGISINMVFLVYVLNSLGGFLGYLTAWKSSHDRYSHSQIFKIVLLRGALTFSLLPTTWMPRQNLILPIAILSLMGFAYGLFHIYILSASMEIIPPGKAGLFNVFLGIGNACGSFAGPFIAQTFGFSHVFVIAGAIFVSTFIAFKISFKTPKFKM